jgi:transcriptional regulator with XRE-family HTH domain
MLKQHRIALRLSQSELARLSGVSRLRIHHAEHGDLTLTKQEEAKICAALQAEVSRLQKVSPSIGALELGSADVRANKSAYVPGSKL